MAEADARATARRHTAQLLKMLRGYGPTAEPEPAAEPPAAAPPPVAVAEHRPPIFGCSTPSQPHRHCPFPHRRLPCRPVRAVGPGSIPTVGEFCATPLACWDNLWRRRQLNRLSQIFHAYLPPHLRDHAVLVRLDAEGWEVQTDSASWATRLR